MPSVKIEGQLFHTEDMTCEELELLRLLELVSGKLRIVEDEIAVCETALAAISSSECQLFLLGDIRRT